MTEPRERCRTRCWVEMHNLWLYPSDFDGQREIEVTGKCMRCDAQVYIVAVNQAEARDGSD